MVANIATKSNGEVRMAHTDNVEPWWGIGNKITDPTDQELTLKEANMDFEYLVRTPKITLTVEPTDSLTHAWPCTQDSKWCRAIVVRESDGTETEISQCGTVWKPHQPSDIIEFYRQISQSFDLRLETAGVLGNFHKIWAMARVPEKIRVIDDEVHTFISFITGVRGTATYTAGHTCAIVCQNTMQIALSEGSAVKYTHHQELDVDAAVRNLNIDMSAFQKYETQAVRMAHTRAKPELAAKYFQELLLGPRIPDWYGDKEDNRMVKYSREYDQLQNALFNSPGQRMVSRDQTVYGLLNAATFWTDHSRRTKNGGDGRASSILTGESARIKRRAWDMAVRLAA